LQVALDRERSEETREGFAANRHGGVCAWGGFKKDLRWRRACLRIPKGRVRQRICVGEGRACVRDGRPHVRDWLLHDIAFTNIVWCMAYNRGVGGESYIAQ